MISQEGKKTVIIVQWTVISSIKRVVLDGEKRLLESILQIGII